MQTQYGKTTCERGALERNQRFAAGAQASAREAPWAQAEGKPRGAHGHSLYIENRNGLGGFAAGAWMRMRHDMLAAHARLAGGRGMGSIATALARKARRGGQNRLVEGGCRLKQREGCFWGRQTGPNPVDRAKPGSKHHVLTDAKGVPLNTCLSAANRHDSTYLFALLAGLPDCLRRKILRLYADRAYDSAAFRRRLKTEGIEPFLAKRCTAHGSGLGTKRWVVERTIAWLHQFRRLRIRYERHGYMHRAFLSLAASIIMSRFLIKPFC
jgi:transposase